MFPGRQTLATFHNFFSVVVAKVLISAIITGVSEEPPNPQTATLESVQSLFLVHIDIIRGFIRALARDPHLTEDVLQETFLTVSKKADSFEPGTNFPRWACAIARLKLLEVRRRREGRLVLLSEEAIEALAVSDHTPEKDTRLDFLGECIALLPASMKRAVEMRYVGEHKPAEIARAVGWSAEAIYVSLSRARTLLRECVDQKIKLAKEPS
jgi:RNA polymerase sigma-70 factor (ECF subfamily)